MITGVRPETFESLLLNAGAFLVGFDYSSYEDLASLKAAVIEALKNNETTLGATRGGGSFQATPEVRHIEADGKRYEFVGSTIFDSWEIKMTGTLLEVTARNMKRALSAADLDESTEGIKRIKIRTDILPTDYLENLVWVGDTSKGLALIALENALNITGASLTFTDKGEGTLPFEFHAHQKSVEDLQYAPCEIVYFDAA